MRFYAISFTFITLQRTVQLGPESRAYLGVCFDKKVYLKLLDHIEVRGILLVNILTQIILPNSQNTFQGFQAFDEFFNLLLSDVEETVTTHNPEEVIGENYFVITKRTFPLLFVRGDCIELMSRPVAIENFEV